MSLRLKSLELYGYKTFANRTIFEFAGPITVIVGPNGSGKSNIADSLRWVLGEQSYSILRGKKTEDMIFAGSEYRPRAGMASATVLFDNSEGWLPIDFSEVAITRRAYRDGENEYLINGQRVRLKDVHELLAKSGLAERTYTIIGQGLVDTALSLRAEERRRLFEEAAGIGLYRTRREEALRRLEITQRNLERVQDILAELQPRLRSLERQARRAQEYEQLRADLRVLLREWYGYHWHLAQKELAQAIEAARRQERALEQARQEHIEIEEKLNHLRSKLQAVRGQLNDWHRQLADLHKQRGSLGMQRAVVEERLRSLAEQQHNLQDEKRQLQEELEFLQERLRWAEAEVERYQNEFEEARLRAEKARQALKGRQEEQARAEENYRAMQRTLVALQSRKEQLRARREEILERSQQQTRSLEKMIKAVEEEEAKLQEAKDKARLLQEKGQNAEKKRRDAERRLSEHQAHLMQVEALRRDLHERRAALAAEMGRLQAQLDVLEQAEADLQGYGQGARVLIQAARLSRLKGARGILSHFLEVPPEFEVAIAAALGEFLDAVIMERDEDSLLALDLLGKTSARGVLLPLDSLHPHFYRSEKDGLDRATGVFGWASELVVAPAELRPAVELLLGRTLVVRDRQTARQIIQRYAALGDDAPGLRAVTLEGEIFYLTGQILAGRGSPQTSLSLSRQRRNLRAEIKSLEEQIAHIEAEINQIERNLGEMKEGGARLEKELAQARREEEEVLSTYNQVGLSIETTQRQVQWLIEQRQQAQEAIKSLEAEANTLSNAQTQLEDEIREAEERLQQVTQVYRGLSPDDFQTQVAYWNTQETVAQQGLAHAVSQLEERRLAGEKLLKSLQSCEERLSGVVEMIHALESEQVERYQQERGINVQIEALHALINPAEAELEALEQEVETLQSEEAAARQNLAKAEHNYAQAKIALVRHQEALENWRRRIEDDFGLVAFEYAEEVSGPTPLPLEGMVEQLPRLTQLPPEIEENIRRLRAQMRRMGAVNPEAQMEYQEVKQRYEFMSAQVEDLKRAEEDVRQVIAELDEMMQRQLQRTFEAVAHEFSAIFRRLFDGGTARLVLTEPDDMTHSGIEIEARLPGRRTQGLSLLSGGERSLTATALIFALLKVAPTPFCLLDEVDAMLDEANVGRFSELLRELSQHTQFIVVTHNRNTVQVADVIYGVTMGRDSSSQVISLKMDEVEKVIVP